MTDPIYTPTSLPSDANIPGRVTELQKRYLAKAVVSGVFTQVQLAVMLRRSQATIVRLVNEDEETRQFIEEYENRVLQGMVESRFTMLEMMDQALRNVQADLTGTDPKLRFESSWRVIDRVVPKSNNDTNGIGGQRGAQSVDPAGAQAIADGFNAMARVIGQVADSAAFSGSAMRSIKTGPEALPGPEVASAASKGEGD